MYEDDLCHLVKEVAFVGDEGGGREREKEGEGEEGGEKEGGLLWRGKEFLSALTYSEVQFPVSSFSWLETLSLREERVEKGDHPRANVTGKLS